MKPDILQRLDAYCAFYGIGRGRAIGHLLQGALPDPSWHPQLIDFTAEREVVNSSDPADDQAAESSKDRPAPLFHAGDRIVNNAGTRRGQIAAEPCTWISQVRLPCGTLRPGHWSYAVAWDGQMGLTIRYAEDLLQQDQGDQQQLC